MIHLEYVEKAKRRITDSWGGGQFGDPRGSRKHKGIDLYVPENTYILPITTGKVTKIGYCYSDDLSYRYVQITTTQGADWRYFYINPLVRVGDNIRTNTFLGSVQGLDDRYNTKEKGPIKSHCHVEVKINGVYVDPDNVNK